MSRTGRFLHGVWLGYAYQGLIMLVGLWLTPFLLRHIGQHDYGVWLVGTQLLLYLTLLDVGVIAMLPRETAYVTGRSGGAKDPVDLQRLFGEVGGVMLYQTPVVILAVLLVWFFMPANWQEFRGPIAVIMATFVVTFPLRIFQATLQGLQDFNFVGRAQIITWSVSTAVTIGLVLKGLGLYALVIGWALSQLLLAGVAAARISLAFPMVLPRRLPFVPWSVLHRYLSRGFWITLSQVATTLSSGVDLLIIGKFFGAAAVVPYACTGKLVSVLANQPALLMQAAEPGLAELRVEGTPSRILQAVTALAQALLMLSGLLACVVLSINRNFVSWWVGPVQYSGLTLTILVVANMLLRHWNTTAVYSVFCFGYERRICITNLLDGCVTAGAALLLVSRFGPISGPIGSILGVCLVSLPTYLTLLKREIGVSFGALIAPLWPWFWRFTLASIGAVVINLYWRTLNIFEIAAIAALIGAVYAALMFHPGQDSALGTYLRPRFAPLWRRLAPGRSLAL